MTRASSPCIHICQIDPVTALCIGCGRTMPEIGNWLRMQETERVSIIEALPERMRAASRERTRIMRERRRTG
jgi:uncharacterized protein